jgi:Xaa-Pro aminopeptidase
MPNLLLPQEEFSRRQERLRSHLAKLGLTGAVVFHPVRVTYLTGFAFYPTERPIALILPVDADPVMMVPALEEQHLLSQARSVKAHVYFEYPGREHPMLQLGKLAARLGHGAGNWGADCDGYVDLNGYQGPPLSEVLGSKVSPISDAIDRMRMVKSPAELEILREAGHLAARAHRLLHKGLAVGRVERILCRQAEERTLADAAALGEGDTWGFLSVIVTILAGTRTGMPHAATGMRRIQLGDGVVTICEAIAGGYHTELERTLFMGPPSERQRRYYEVAHDAQQLALSLLRPGALCAEIDAKVSKWFAAEGCSEFALHHQGHGLGLEGHERPFLDVGDGTVLEAGMVLSVEPGLYVPGIGGFRNSDTVVVGEREAETLTPYTHQLAELVV